ncbi:MAG: anaerobic ribonucleoside-triphosphate reductase activating protein [Eubacteriales bacterium]|jgi:anaerobic ribonucleoside-triphosphate reductase activating protein|nr:anaerobic ribonucleoside-triphosphate reductase activating protein [Eubacteriales bacterium]NCC81600.1 anaerobic ribonucleoside-triphosphate reductase activating protein [Clostridia bacterium]
MIRYAHILNDSIVDGPGMRLVVFLQGCKWNCEGCHNPHLFPLDEGIEIDEVQLAKIILKKINSMHSGITFSGGDPILQKEALLKVIKYIRSRRPDINIWVYTGFLFEDINNLPLLKEIDVLVDGQFKLNEKDISLKFKGSANQRVIDIKKSLQNNKVTLL